MFPYSSWYCNPGVDTFWVEISSVLTIAVKPHVSDRSKWKARFDATPKDKMFFLELYSPVLKHVQFASLIL